MCYQRILVDSLFSYDFVVIIIIITPLRVFHISVSWCFLTRFGVTESILKSAGCVSVFWPILKILQSGWYPLVLFKSSCLFINPFVIVPSTLIATPSTSCTIIFFSSLPRSRYLCLFSLPFILNLSSSRMAKSTLRLVLFNFLFFFLVIVAIDYHWVWSSGWYWLSVCISKYRVSRSLRTF